MGEFDYQVETIKEDGIFNYGKFDLKTKQNEYEIPLPVKTIPVKLSSESDDIYSRSDRVNEVYHTINATDLRNAIYQDEPTFIEHIKQKQEQSDDGQLDIALLNYSETKVMTPLEAQEFVRAIDEVSDIITCPLQFPLLHSFVEGDPVDAIDSPFEYYKTTKENFLQEAAALDSAKPLMGSLSFIRGGQLNRLLQLYDDFNVEILGVDFCRENPTSIIDSDLGALIGRLSALDLFDGSVLFGYNMARSQYRSTEDIRRAENFSLVGMGFDIIGGNHLGLNYAPKGDRSNYSLFDPDVAGYRPIAVDDVEEDWPVTVQENILPERVASFQPNTASDLVRLINSGQLQSALAKLRTRMEDGHLVNFIKNKEGIDTTMEEAFDTALTAYQAGYSPDVDRSSD